MLGSHKFTNGTACHQRNQFFQNLKGSGLCQCADFEKNISRTLLDLFLRADFMNWRRPMVLRLLPVCVILFVHMNARKEEQSVWGSLQRERFIRAKCEATDSQYSILKGLKNSSLTKSNVGHAKYTEFWMHLNGSKAYGLHSPSWPGIGAGHPRFELFYV